ncbi:TolC family protein [Candidatus Ichthyocystis sparus]|uniref:TolC family protein n=1 Tax=Candidatus Ichthyocystis sparus TaxID=1561004 RepID=UPI000B83B9C9|nr:TolC family protein [Candidatus Ichthyocystis sparus]
MFLDRCRWDLICLMGFLFTFSQSAKSITLSEAYNLSKSRDPAYLSAQAQKKVADTLVRQAQAGYLPSVSASAGVQSTYPAPLPPHIQSTAPKQWYFDSLFSLSVQESLVDMTVSKAVKSAKMRAQAASYTVQQEEYNLATRVMDAYLAVSSAQEKLESLYARRKVLLEQMRQARRKFDSGTATIADVQYSQAQYSLSTADIVSAQALERSSMAALRILVGQQVDKVDTLSIDNLGPLNMKAINYPLNYWISTARLKSPSILTKYMLLSAAKNDISTQKAAHFPILKLTATSKYNSLDLTSAVPSAFQPSLVVGVQLTIPLFLGGAVSAKVDEFIHRSVAAYEDYRQTLNQINLMTEQSYLNFMNGLNHINAMKIALSSEKTALSANQLGYRTGTKILLDVLAAENQVYTLESQLVSEVVSTLKSYVNLKINAGVFSVDDLKFVDSCLVE